MTIQIENDPFPEYDALLDRGPVSWDENFGMWAIAGYDVVREVAADIDRFSVEHGYRGAKGDNWAQVAGKPAGNLSTRFLRYTDPPAWDTARWLTMEALPYSKLDGEESRPQALRDQIQPLVSSQLEKSKSKGIVEGIQEWCQPLPCFASLAMLGLPLEDFEKLRDWTLDGILLLVRNPTDHDFWGDAAADKANSAAEKLVEYLREHFAKKRECPGDDAISRLIAYADKYPEKKIEEFQLIQVVANLLMGGFHESSMALLADGIYLLLANNQYRDLVDDPSLVSGAVEEIIRFHALAPIAPRRAKEDVTIGGVDIKKDDLCLLYFGAAQRDPAQFKNGRTFDVRRPGEANGNLSFGTGPHKCAGQPHIRMLANIFFETLVKTYPNLRLTEWPENHYMTLRYQPRADIVLLESLPLALG